MQTETRTPSHTNAAHGVWAERGHCVPAHHPQGGLKVARARPGGDFLTAVQRPPRQMPGKTTQTQPMCLLFPMCPQCGLCPPLCSKGAPVYCSPGVSGSPQREAGESHGFYSSCLTPHHAPLPPRCPPHLPRAKKLTVPPVGIQPCCFLGPALRNAPFSKLFSYKDFAAAFASCQDPE